jgi:hypothetical protein
MKIKDDVTLGLASGVIGGSIALFIHEFVSKYSKNGITWIDRASSLMISESYKHSKEAKVIGTVVATTLSALAGVGQVYMYNKSGKENRRLKAVGYGIVAWMGFHGIGSRIADSFYASTPQTISISLAMNLISSVLTSEAINILGADKGMPGRRGIYLQDAQGGLTAGRLVPKESYGSEEGYGEMPN